MPYGNWKTITVPNDLLTDVNIRATELGTTPWKIIDKALEDSDKVKTIKKQVLESQLKDSKEYLETHTKPEPHDVVMSRYWLEKGIYGTILDLRKILEAED